MGDEQHSGCMRKTGSLGGNHGDCMRTYTLINTRQENTSIPISLQIYRADTVLEKKKKFFWYEPGVVGAPPTWQSQNGPIERYCVSTINSFNPKLLIISQNMPLNFGPCGHASHWHTTLQMTEVFGVEAELETCWALSVCRVYTPSLSLSSFGLSGLF